MGEAAGTGVTGEFFEGLARRGHEPMLVRLTATLRWDVVDGATSEHWSVRIRRGDLQVTRDDEPRGDPDCVITAERPVCDCVISGRTSALSALLRGVASVEGDLELMVLAQRLFARGGPGG